MSISLIIFILIHLFIFAYVVELFRRVGHRHREYPLTESKETLPFGFLKLRYIMVLFVITYLAWVVFSFWLYDYFVGSLSGAILRI